MFASRAPRDIIRTPEDDALVAAGAFREEGLCGLIPSQFHNPANPILVQWRRELADSQVSLHESALDALEVDDWGGYSTVDDAKIIDHARRVTQRVAAFTKLDELLQIDIPEDAVDEQAAAWHRTADHPFFKECLESDGPLLDAMIAKLDEVHRYLTALDEYEHNPVEENFWDDRTTPAPTLPLDPAPWWVEEAPRKRYTHAEVRASAGEGEYGGIIYNLAAWRPREGYNQNREDYQ